MWLFWFLILFMSFFFKKKMWVCVLNTWQVTVPHDAEFCVSACWKMAASDLRWSSNVFRHFLEKQNQSQGTPSDKHLLKPRVIYWLDWRAVHPLSMKSMRQISHAAQITSLKVCMHSACICNQIFMNDFFFKCVGFFSFYFKYGSVQIFIWLCVGMHRHVHPSWFCLRHCFVCCRSPDVAFVH